MTSISAATTFFRQGHRRGLVAATLAGIAGLGAALWWRVERADGWDIWLTTAIAALAVASVAGFIALRRLTDNVAEGVDSRLDERQRQVRDGAHRDAYYIVSLLLVLALLVAPQAIVALPAVLLLNIMPSAVIAWRESEAP